ncbi:MAG: DUF4158 domain-containing protein [Bryobacteraceae bacterium]
MEERITALKRNWTDDELIVYWTLQPDERSFLSNKAGVTRLGFAILFKFFQFMGCFPRHAGEVPAAVVEYVAKQVGVSQTFWPEYSWQGRAIEYHRAQIRSVLGFREPTAADSTALIVWLNEQVGARDEVVKYRLDPLRRNGISSLAGSHQDSFDIGSERSDGLCGERAVHCRRTVRA